MKVHQLAKELGIKPADVNELAGKLGLGEDTYKGISKEISLEDELEIRSGFARGEEEIEKELKFIADNQKVLMVGMVYDDESNTYRIAELDLELKYFLDLGGKLSQKYNSVYNAQSDFQLILGRKDGILTPNKLENVRERKRRKK